MSSNKSAFQCPGVNEITYIFCCVGSRIYYCPCPPLPPPSVQRGDILSKLLDHTNESLHKKETAKISKYSANKVLQI